MIKTIFQKELKELGRDARFKMSLSIVIVLLLIAIVSSFNQYQRTINQYKTSKNAEREAWDTQEDKNPHSAAHDGTYVFKPKYALALFDNGINDYTGNVVFLEAHKRNEGMYSEAADQTEFARFGKLSLNFIFIYLFPLLILLIGYNSVTKEKEFETLNLMKSQGVKPIQLILGKWLSIFIPIFIVMSFVFLILGITLSLISDLEYFSWINLGLLFLVYSIYYGILTTITILISTISKSSGISLVGNLSIWLIFCFIMPKIATDIANISHSYPTRQEFHSQIKEDSKKNGFNAHDPNNKEAKEFKKEILKKYSVDSISQLKINYTGLLLQKGEEVSSKIFKKHYNKIKDVFKKQNIVYQKMAILSPFIPTRLFSMDLTNTGYLSDWNFSEGTENYRLEVQRFLNNDLRDNSKNGDWNYKMKSEKFKNLPKFEYTPENLKSILQWNVTNIIILSLWFAFSFILLIRFSKKL